MSASFPVALFVLLGEGFTLFAENAEFLQFSGPAAVDFLLANRPLSYEMLERSKQLRFLGIPYIHPEDFIALKIQAYKNNPKRIYRDRADIAEIVRLKGDELDWNKIQMYAEAFDEWSEIQKMR